uniref:NAC domain-containing protein 69 isoform X2 n=1 Tax=Rhizophora mucronata TaxID=61149 RepID=A0A2P2IIR6_RHIMU
MNTLWMRRK